MAATPRAARASPTSRRASWLWGGTPEAIAETIRVGINSAHADSRVSQMPAFGRDHVLERPDMENVVAYVLSLSGDARRRPAMSRPARPCSRRTAPPVTAPTARARPTSAHPTSPTRYLDPWRRRSVDLQRRVGRPAGADAELGRPAVADRSQDPRPLHRRPREAAGHERAAPPPRQDPHGRRPFVAGGIAAVWRAPMRTSSMWR